MTSLPVFLIPESDGWSGASGCVLDRINFLSVFLGVLFSVCCGLNITFGKQKTKNKKNK